MCEIWRKLSIYAEKMHKFWGKTKEMYLKYQILWER